jgi:type IX secretion system PorP/SprF family membrane protein
MEMKMQQPKKYHFMKKIAAIFAILFLSVGSIRAQQDIMVSQYMFNGLFLNPAYAGSHKYMGASLLHRRQWVNFPGAPVTSIFAIDGPLAKRRMGWGVMVATEKIGATSQTDLFGNYSYNVPLAKGKLAFGLRAGGSLVTANLSQLKTVETGDEAFATNIRSKFLPKFGAGVYYYAKMFYAGISVPTLVAYDSKKDFSFDVSASSTVRHHSFLTAGYVFVINPMVKLKPSVLVKYQTAAPVQADVNLNVLLNDVLWLGGSFRTGESIVGLVEYQINSMFRVGYAFDYNLTQIRRFSAGSHEIMLGIDFGRDILKTKNPRFF